MQLKGIKTILNEKERAIKLPNKKSIVLKSVNQNNKDQIIYLIETLLSREYTDYYAKVDSNFGFQYMPLSKISVLDFTNGKIIGKNSTIRVNGEIPKIHCVRYVRNGVIRSFLCDNSEHAGTCLLNYNMTRYTKDVSDAVWYRIIEIVNKFLGYKAVELVDKELRFHFTTTKYSVEAQKIIYMLISECVLTPENYLRVVLLSDIECMTEEQQIDLIMVLDNLKGHEMLISSGNINNINNPVLAFVNI